MISDVLGFRIWNRLHLHVSNVRKVVVLQRWHSHGHEVVGCSFGYNRDLVTRIDENMDQVLLGRNFDGM